MGGSYKVLIRSRTGCEQGELSGLSSRRSLGQHTPAQITAPEYEVFHSTLGFKSATSELQGRGGGTTESNRGRQALQAGPSSDWAILYF